MQNGNFRFEISGVGTFTSQWKAPKENSKGFPGLCDDQSIGTLTYPDFGVRVGCHVFLYFSMLFFHIWLLLVITLPGNLAVSPG